MILALVKYCHLIEGCERERERKRERGRGGERERARERERGRGREREREREREILAFPNAIHTARGKLDGTCGLMKSEKQAPCSLPRKSSSPTREKNTITHSVRMLRKNSGTRERASAFRMNVTPEVADSDTCSWRKCNVLLIQGYVVLFIQGIEVCAYYSRQCCPVYSRN